LTRGTSDWSICGMAQDPPRQSPPPRDAKAAAKAARLAREAAALRANLRRRKDQARERVEPPVAHQPRESS
jgi:hypothetical protein